MQKLADIVSRLRLCHYGYTTSRGCFVLPDRASSRCPFFHFEWLCDEFLILIVILCHVLTANYNAFILMNVKNFIKLRTIMHHLRFPTVQHAKCIMYDK
jgi:hypothetical protein